MHITCPAKILNKDMLGMSLSYYHSTFMAIVIAKHAGLQVFAIFNQVKYCRWVYYKHFFECLNKLCLVFKNTVFWLTKETGFSRAVLKWSIYTWFKCSNCYNNVTFCFNTFLWNSLDMFRFWSTQSQRKMRRHNNKVCFSSIGCNKSQKWLYHHLSGTFSHFCVQPAGVTARKKSRVLNLSDGLS